MNNKSYTLTADDYEAFLQKAPANKVLLIWSDIISQIRYEQLKKEAREKGFSLEPNATVKHKRAKQGFAINVNEASTELNSEIKKIGNSVVLLNS